MEDLNKNQIVLLTLLVSFVTSIATGIITVSLLQQAPLEVTRNINRIVEKTIEKVTPANILTAVPQQKEVTTVIVKEEDSITQSIDKNLKSIVRIRAKDALLNDVFYGIGLVINKDGLIAADRKTINLQNIYIGIMSDGIEFKLIPTDLDKETNFIIFKTNLPETNNNKTGYIFVPATFADAEPKLGQTLISIGGDASNAVSVGRITSLFVKDLIIGTTTAKIISNIDTDVSSRDLVDGAPVLNLSGQIIGIKLFSNAPKSFTPIAVLKKELTILMETSGRNL